MFFFYQEPARYNFRYDVNDQYSGNDFGHEESRDGDRVVGQYYVLLPDGRKQVNAIPNPLTGEKTISYAFNDNLPFRL